MDSPRLAGRPAHLGWRLLALTYDFFPLLALWLLGSALLLLLQGGEPARPGSWQSWLQLLFLWLLTGAYAVGSWRRGGQTLGMRPWRLRVVSGAGAAPTLAALYLRYATALVSLLPLGLGFAWSLFDSERRTWHDRLSGTRLLRMEATPAKG
jgi:uncharacterized RDD family membrane protein YckC